MLRILSIHALLFVAFLSSSASYASEAIWEVGVVFLGATLPDDYQRDIDRNLLELAALSPNHRFRLSILRDFPERSVFYAVDPASPDLHEWDSLFFEIPHPGIPVPGDLEIWTKDKNGESILRENYLKLFFQRAFSEEESRKILILYGHGHAHDGLEKVSLMELKTLLSKSGIRFDILWLDACFMATVEVAYELRETAHYLIASEEAEFAAGTPFDALQALAESPENVETIGSDLIRRFIESYSYLKSGSQHRVVLSSPATVTLINLEKISSFVDRLAHFSKAVGRFSPEQRASLKQSNIRRRTERGDLADLGSLMRAISTHRLFSEQPEVHRSAREILDLLEVRNWKAGLRVLIQPPIENSLMVFGYENWTRGDQGDLETVERLPASLKPISDFISGPRNLFWPARRVQKRLYVSPFPVDFLSFHIFFADPVTRKAISEPVTYERLSDFSLFISEEENNPIVSSGYTHGTGSQGERYTGLGILDPSLGNANLHYIETDFAKETGWGNL
ncbi:MAG: hypothetical protein HY391_05980 [Deltaproteobacteria bacterium]|nr:hypothetical protein [Deltaproteobacteria bacterium]